MTTFTTEDLYECMDAYQLAEHVDMWGRDLIALNMKGGVPCILGAKMLRQQADRITELEKNFDALNAKHTKLITQQSAEPVAWMHKTYFSNGLYEDDLVWSKIDENSIPLYTAPQPHPAKTLTDAEFDNIFANGKRLGVLETENRIWAGINSMTEEIGLITTDPRFSHIESPLLLEFAKAILRKAQEK